MLHIKGKKLSDLFYLQKSGDGNLHMSKGLKANGLKRRYQRKLMAVRCWRRHVQRMANRIWRLRPRWVLHVSADSVQHQLALLLLFLACGLYRFFGQRPQCENRTYENPHMWQAWPLLSPRFMFREFGRPFYLQV